MIILNDLRKPKKTKYNFKKDKQNLFYLKKNPPQIKGTFYKMRERERELA